MLLESNILDDLAYRKESSTMDQVLADLCGLLFILTGSFCGIAVGSWLCGSLGAILGLVVGAVCGFHVAESCTLPKRTRKKEDDETHAKGLVTLLAQSEKATLSNSKRAWFSKILGRKPAKPSLPEAYDFYSLEEVHCRLRAMNSQLWRELRQGVLSSCYAGLYSVKLEEDAESLDWREVNRRTVAALHRFESAMNDEERLANLNDALDQIGQKLLLVQKAALRKADRLSMEEKREIQKNEAELWRLSRSARVSPSQN